LIITGKIFQEKKMRKLTEEEIRKLMNEMKWGTIMAVDDGQPYAVETSFATDDKFLYTGTRCGGRMNRCIEKHNRVSFKICDSTKDTGRYGAAIVESEATILKDVDEIMHCLRIIITKIGWSLSGLEAKAEKIAAGTGSLSLHRLPLKNLGGVGHGI
jgi:nitroimidazol reductase NimA-like FMN-containing flavoprotein (pyridoxamine 5'-phosphate oxidase superfamily)